MTRREFLAGAAALAAPPVARSAMGFSPDCFGISRAPREAFAYLQYAWERGAGGVQATLAESEAAYLKRVRARAEELGMYLEIATPLPKAGETEAFERTVKAAKEAGARCIRSVCLSGRRYEKFNTLEEWKAFVAESRARLASAVPVMDRQRLPLGLENHKDWTVEEMAPLVRSYQSEYLGVCIDWGNNVALLDDPVEMAERLAPYAVNSHIKDMAVEECPEGFLLAEVPLGQGMLPLARMLEIIRKARPQARFSLDMLTRNPLLVPCVTEKYWATFPARSGAFLARTLRTVRANRKALVKLDGMEQAARVKLEQENVRQSVDYARDRLGLRV